MDVNTIDNLTEPQWALLQRVAWRELVRRESGLAWSEGDAEVTAEEKELLRGLWRGSLIDLRVGIDHPIELQIRGHDALGEARLLGIPPTTRDAA